MLITTLFVDMLVTTLSEHINGVGSTDTKKWKFGLLECFIRKHKEHV